MNPEEPHNTTVLLNNFFGRQFNSLNDVSVNPRNGEIYFTDVTYGYLQDFRPSPGFPNQVYRLNPDTGSVTVVADGFVNPNGMTCSPHWPLLARILTEYRRLDVFPGWISRLRDRHGGRKCFLRRQPHRAKRHVRLTPRPLPPWPHPPN